MKNLQHQGYSEWLVIRCQQGEMTAFNDLLEHWHRRFYLYALRRLGDRDAALDATQDCLLSISRGLQNLADPAAFPKWSYQILERRCVDNLRRTLRDREVLQADDGITDSGIEEQDALNSRLTVQELLATLDPRLETVLRLFYLEELGIEEIAEICALPPGTVKSRLYYARKLLAGALQDSE